MDLHHGIIYWKKEGRLSFHITFLSFFFLIIFLIILINIDWIWKKQLDIIQIV